MLWVVLPPVPPTVPELQRARVLSGVADNGTRAFPAGRDPCPDQGPAYVHNQLSQHEKSGFQAPAWQVPAISLSVTVRVFLGRAKCRIFEGDGQDVCGAAPDAPVWLLPGKLRSG